MNITDYFDANNHIHVNAYIHTIKTGAWPETFYNELMKNNIELHLNWQIDLVGKLAFEYITLQEKKQSLRKYLKKNEKNS